jgi:hypothetical protein
LNGSGVTMRCRQSFSLQTHQQIIHEADDEALMDVGPRSKRTLPTSTAENDCFAIGPKSNRNSCPSTAKLQRFRVPEFCATLARCKGCS